MMEPCSGDAQRAGLRVTILAMGTRGDVQPLAGEFECAVECLNVFFSPPQSPATCTPCLPVNGSASGTVVVRVAGWGAGTCEAVYTRCTLLVAAPSASELHACGLCSPRLVPHAVAPSRAGG